MEASTVFDAVEAFLSKISVYMCTRTMKKRCRVTSKHNINTKKRQ